MTDEELNEIKSHLTDNLQNWDMRLAQQDRIRLLAEVDRLRAALRADSADPTRARPDSLGLIDSPAWKKF